MIFVMNPSKQPKYMGLTGLKWSTKKQLFDFSSKSIYYWWWQFLRLTPEFWYAQQTKNPITDPELRRVYEAIGGFPSHSFKAWWEQYGSTVFAEVERTDRVRQIDPDQERLAANPETFLVEVPLSLNKREIASQFVLLLNKVHRGRKYDVEAYSNAQLKLYNHKYNLKTLERQYWVMLYKLIYPQAPLWVIGDRLRLALHLDVRHIDRKTVERRLEMMFLQLQSHTWRYHSYAQHLRINLKQGAFPNYTKLALNPDYMPFGPELDQDFKTKTDEGYQSNSPWQLWLKRHYKAVLDEKIYSLNKLQNQYKNDSHFKSHFHKFILGTLEM